MKKKYLFLEEEISTDINGTLLFFMNVEKMRM
jgi:hypothetical protein